MKPTSYDIVMASFRVFFIFGLFMLSSTAFYILGMGVGVAMPKLFGVSCTILLMMLINALKLRR